VLEFDGHSGAVMVLNLPDGNFVDRDIVTKLLRFHGNGVEQCDFIGIHDAPFPPRCAM
jgi:hypothetical protein